MFRIKKDVKFVQEFLFLTINVKNIFLGLEIVLSPDRNSFKSSLYFILRIHISTFGNQHNKCNK